MHLLAIIFVVALLAIALFAQKEANRTISDNFVFVEGGTFKMGSNSKYDYNKFERLHSVTLDSFIMSKYPITQKEWFEVMGTTVRQQRPDITEESYWTNVGIGDDHPMYFVSFYDAIEYCNKRSLKEGLTPVYIGAGDDTVCDWNANGYRLPTESEWEFAAKGGIKDRKAFEYSGSNNVDEVAWYEKNSTGSKPVGTKKPNSLGLHDMSGNVLEWCWDGDYAYPDIGGERINPRLDSIGKHRCILRGGSWGLAAEYVRSACRNSEYPSKRGVNVGFRPVLSVFSDSSKTQGKKPEPKYKIGDIGPAGGIIFYDKREFSDGWQYLEAAPVKTEFKAEWGAYKEKIDTRFYDERVGDGKENTKVLVKCLQKLKEKKKAAQVCADLNFNGFNDWFLPSEGELNLIYHSLKQKGIGDFSDDYYWSSSSERHGYKEASCQDFSDGRQWSKHRHLAYSVRAIRAF